jgi:hypothetical protein
MRRAQQQLIVNDLSKKMVFLTGPRQVGKTSLARQIATETAKAVYLNYDALADREIIRQSAWLPDTELVILDELHKMEGWKNYLKGLYDTRPAHLKILVTGSARLDTFRHQGDSLVGRFFRHRLNPLSVAEISDASEATLDRLMERGGFPEPFLAQEPQDALRWRLQYVEGLIRVDIFDFDKIHDLRAMQLTLDLLRQRVGSPLSYTSMAQDINCAPNTVRKYCEILEALFIIFRVPPYHHNIARSLLKEPKVYFYDTGLVMGDAGNRFENMVAVCLLKHLNAIEDYQGKRAELRYLRTKEKREVDFALVVDNEPVRMIEVKLSDAAITSSLRYFHQKYGIPALQLVRYLRHEQIVDGIELRRAFDYLRTLLM